MITASARKTYEHTNVYTQIHSQLHRRSNSDLGPETLTKTVKKLIQNKKKCERKKKKKMKSKLATTAQEMIFATATWVRLDTTGRVWAMYAILGSNLKTEDWEWHNVTEEEALACCEEREKEPPAAGHKRNLRVGAWDEEAPSPEDQLVSL
jgi:hypothetical protein